MESLFIPANYKDKIVLSNEILNKIKPYSKINLFSSVNFLKQLDEIKIQLEKNNIQVILNKPKRALKCGQILGCDSYCSDFPNLNSSAILYIGDGYFHPDALLFSQMYSEKRTILKYNPKNQELEEINLDRIKDKLFKIKSNLLKYILSKKIGILVSIKSGQERLSDAIKLKVQLEKEGKTAYIFLDDTFNFSKIEDFNFIDSWVNTACPRIAQDDCINIIKPIINIKEAQNINYYLEKINI